MTTKLGLALAFVLIAALAFLQGYRTDQIHELQQQVLAEHERVTQAQIDIIKLQHQDITAAVPVPTSHCTLHDIYVQNPGC